MSDEPKIIESGVDEHGAAWLIQQRDEWNDFVVYWWQNASDRDADLEGDPYWDRCTTSAAGFDTLDLARRETGETVIVSLTHAQRDILTDLVDMTDFDEDYYRELGWDLPEGFFRATYNALRRA